MKSNIAITTSLVVALVLIASGIGGTYKNLAQVGSSDINAITASSCSQAHVQSAIDQVSDGDIVHVPAGTCTWTTGITTSKGITIKGAGIGKTVIIDGLTSNGSIFKLDTVAGKSYRVSGFEFRDGGARTGSLSSGTVQVAGNGYSTRVDHNKFDKVKNNQVRITGYTRGVADNNIHIHGGGQAYMFWHDTWAGGSKGDSSWSEEIDWGGPNAWYVENNSFETTNPAGWGITDTYAGARFVFRNNYVLNATVATHGYGDGAGRQSGLRHFEIYNNTFAMNPRSAGNIAHIRGGTGIWYNNTHDNVYKSVTLHYYRTGSRTCGPFGTPTGLNAFDLNDKSDGPNTPGGAGDGLFAEGVAGTGSKALVLEVPGANWITNQWVGYMAYVPNSSTNENGYFSSIIESNDADTIVVDQNNFPDKCSHIFVPGERFEIRRIITGIGQPGAGTMDLLEDKSTTPTPVNLNLTTDPIYSWGNTLNGSKDIGAGIAVRKDFHYMNQVSPYNGSTGMGMGLLSARPANPSLLRTAYFATDVGSNGTLYVWNGSSWVKRWTPYTYPHPLTTTGPTSDDPNSPPPPAPEPAPEPEPEPEPATPPTITSQPSSASVEEGDNVTFSVSVTSDSVPSYQWQKDGSNISGANTNTYSINGVSLSNAGTYRVRVSNYVGSITSSNATLTVTEAPVPDPEPEPAPEPEPEPEPTPGDSDGDGVLDSIDRCPNTPTSQKDFVNSRGCPLPKADNFDIKSKLAKYANLNRVSDYEIGKESLATIKFEDEMSLVHESGTQLNLDEAIQIEQYKVSVDSNIVPQLNKTSTITMYNVFYDVPVIKRDGVVCTACTIVSHDKSTGVLVFTVPGFSTYEIEGANDDDSDPDPEPENEDSGEEEEGEEEQENNDNGGGGSSSSGSSSSSFDVTCRVSNTKVAPGSSVSIEVDIDHGESPYDIEWGDDAEDIAGFNLGATSQVITFSDKEKTYELDVAVTDDTGDREKDGCPSVRVDDKYGKVTESGAAPSSAGTLSQNVNFSGLPTSRLIEIRSLVQFLSLLNLVDQSKTSTVLIMLNQAIGDAGNTTVLLPATSGAYQFSRNLGMDMQGEDVRQLQIFLNQRGYAVYLIGPGSRGQETSYYSFGTRGALIKFQRAQGLPQTGIFDTATRARVNGLIQ